MSHQSGWLAVLVACGTIASCRQESATPDDSSGTIGPVTNAAAGSPNALVDLLDPRVPRAAAGDRQWRYVQRARADFDADGQIETAVLIADVELDARGAPLWEDGHRWQLYFEEADSSRTYAYARFLPNGKLEASLTVPAEQKMPTVVLRESTPNTLAIYEVQYSGPERSRSVRHLHRELDPGEGFSVGR